MQLNKDGELNSYRLSGLSSALALLLLLGASSNAAQSYEEYLKSQNESFKQYRDARDAEFHGYLKEQWKEFKLFKGEKLYEKPKPKKLPAAKKIESEKVGPKVFIKPKKIVRKVLKKEPKAVKKVDKNIEKISTPIIVIDKDTFMFFKTQISISVPKNIQNYKYDKVSQEDVSAFFDIAVESDYEKSIEEIKKVVNDLKLNDWGLYQLLTQVSKDKINDKNTQVSYRWFVFNKLGYASKIALQDSRLLLLNYSSNVIYSTPNYTFSKKNYYAIDYYNSTSLGQIRTYKNDYPKASKALDLSLKNLPLLSMDKKVRKIIFNDGIKKHKIDLPYNKNMIDFLSTYPQADYKTYFDAPMQDESALALVEALKPLLDDQRASEAINTVLHFVQKSFDYKRDDEQFGREKVMFAQETIFYKSSDCEDRAVLFSYLVRELFNIDVVGLKYSDHMSTAIALPLSGQSLKIQNKKYVVADPTYINANVGLSMPKYRKIMPKRYIEVK